MVFHAIGMSCGGSGWGETVCPTDVKGSAQRAFPSSSLFMGN